MYKTYRHKIVDEIRKVLKTELKQYLDYQNQEIVRWSDCLVTTRMKKGRKSDRHSEQECMDNIIEHNAKRRTAWDLDCKFFDALEIYLTDEGQDWSYVPQTTAEEELLCFRDKVVEYLISLNPKDFDEDAADKASVAAELVLYIFDRDYTAAGKPSLIKDRLESIAKANTTDSARYKAAKYFLEVMEKNEIG